MKPESPLVTMRGDERICFDRAMEQWNNSLKRPDFSEEDRVKGALLAYQRQAFVFHENALLAAEQRGMEKAAEIANTEMDACLEQGLKGPAIGAKFARDAIRQAAKEIKP